MQILTQLTVKCKESLILFGFKTINNAANILIHSIIFCQLVVGATSWSQAEPTTIKMLTMTIVKAERQQIRLYTFVLKKPNMIKYKNWIKVLNHKLAYMVKPPVLPSDLLVPLTACGSMTHGASSITFFSE